MFPLPSWPQTFPGINGHMQLVIGERFVGRLQVNGPPNLGQHRSSMNLKQGKDKKKHRKRHCTKCGDSECPRSSGGWRAKNGQNKCKLDE